MLSTGMILTASVAWFNSSVAFLAGLSNFNKRRINELVLAFAGFWLVVGIVWFLGGLRLWFAWRSEFAIDRIIFIVDQIVVFWHFIPAPYFVVRQWFSKKVSLIISRFFWIGAVTGMVFILIKGVELKEITFFASKYSPNIISWLLFVIMFSLVWLSLLVRFLLDLVRKLKGISVPKNILLANFSIILYGILGFLDESGLFRNWELVFLRLFLILPPILAYIAFEEH